jgi:Tfp pilus assembly protein PilV
MWNTTSNEKGIGLIEVCIALFLLAIGVLGLIAIQPSAWRQSARSDSLGRAVGILAQELQAMEVFIMNPNNTVDVVDVGGKKMKIYSPVTILPSDPSNPAATPKPGDLPFTVNTTAEELVVNSAYRVTVQVTWPGNTNGIRESMIVTRQESYNQ